MRVVGALLGCLCLGCFGPDLGDQPFQCGALAECPPGYHCGEDRLCRQRIVEPAVPTDAGAPDVVPRCDPATPLQCLGADHLVQCGSDGEVVQATVCAGFCDPDALACATLEPANLPADSCLGVGELESLHLAGEQVIDLTTCPGLLVAQEQAAPICVVRARDFTVEEGAHVRFTGASAVAIVAESISVAGTIDVGAAGGEDGPGVQRTSPGRGGSVADHWSTGGGGAGHGTDGKPGAKEDGGAGGAPGKAYGSTSVVPLRAGSPGGAGGDMKSECEPPDCPVIAAGGGGGGALQLVACTRLVLGAGSRIDAGGGGGAGGFGSKDDPEAGGGGGGGSGGGVLIEAPYILVPTGAIIAANGGGGGGGGQHDSAGRPGMSGAAGLLGEAPAPGGPGAVSEAGAGGNGGTRSMADDKVGDLPTMGLGSNGHGQGGGGGGGAAGRVRLNGLQTSVSGTVSPAPSLGKPAHN